MIRKIWKLRKRHANQTERARVRDEIHAGWHDPDSLLDLGGVRKTSRRMHSGGILEREGMLHARQRKIRAELKTIKDLAPFIQGMSRSKTLHSTIALGYFRHILGSDEYAEDHRYKLAIREALQDPVLAKVIQRKWEAYDREFPQESAKLW